jgi:NADPH:quinone reductase-like Zn-dependent oxidoreductase
MKAAVYYETGGPEVFRYEDMPDPVCDAGGVLIDVRAISIEGGDTMAAQSAHRRLAIRGRDCGGRQGHHRPQDRPARL